MLNISQNERIKCFKLNNDILYLDKVLIEFDRIPELFVCRDDFNRYFISLLVNYEEYHYILKEIDKKRLIMLLNGGISLGTAFYPAPLLYVVTGGEMELDNILIIRCDIELLKILSKNSEIRIEPNGEIKEYIKNLESKNVKVDGGN